MTRGYRPPPPGLHPPNNSPAYTSTALRAPRSRAVAITHSLSETTGPSFARAPAASASADLTILNGGAALGERIIIAGRVLGDDGRPIANAMLEIWQANSAGRYAHPEDRHDAPLDPHFSGAAQIVTGSDGAYRIVTIKPGAYPWRNHPNAWRPRHIHFSVFGPAFASRLVTQMYFPGDPLLDYDPIYLSVPGAEARARLLARFDLNTTIADYALGYQFDIVLRGGAATPAQN